MKKNLTLFLSLFLTTCLSFAQDFSAAIESYLQENHKQFLLEQTDVSDVSISAQSYSKSLKAYNVYADQTLNGVKIFNSSSSFVVKDGKVINANVSFQQNISNKINSNTPSITATDAISRAVNGLGINNPSGLQLIETLGNHSYVFNNGNISLENIPVELVYQPIQEGAALKLAWDLSIYLLDASHYYSVRVDAMTGELIDVLDWVLSCDFGDAPHSHEGLESILHTSAGNATQASFLANTPQYRVFPIPLIGPNEGTDQLITDPSDPDASPYGWHDTNGEPGHEFTTSRGNNVLANEDLTGNNAPGALADGGEEMLFDFAFDLPQNPHNFTDGAITNLFYMNNIMHDVFYQYGFDEPSGNFQANNYGRGGAQNDYVVADAQDGGGLNNANFATPPDGSRPRMQMYLWNAPGTVPGAFLTVNNGPLAGSYNGIDSGFGPDLPTSPITADFALMQNTGNDPHDGCGTVTNAAELSGKIVIIRRGSCNFTDKVQKAQDAGAVAVIMVNNENGEPIIMGGDGPNITIPSIMIYKDDGEEIISALQNGDSVNGTLLDDGSGTDPYRRDGDLDNMIIAHEYGHGISNRLTGGPQRVNCLQNEEQMGEGWSDYFGLMLTIKPGDRGEDIRGVGTYAIGQGKRGVGIRTHPYSTDFGVNPFTYNSIRSQSVPHGVGSVWTTMLWDLTWAFIDEYGFDEDVYNGNGGNNKVLQLVIDGLKLQRCSPGFVDGRDAILEADVIANNGENQCLIWHAFANRGLGLSADQGSSNNRRDGTEAFDVPEECRLGVGNLDNIKNKFIIYPNPSYGEVNIQTRFDISEANVTIYDMNGRKVFEQDIEMQNTASINTSALTPGIYMIKIEGEGHSQTSKLIIR